MVAAADQQRRGNECEQRRDSGGEQERATKALAGLLVAWIASHIEAEYPKSLGAGCTDASLPLCEDYLRRFS